MSANEQDREALAQVLYENGGSLAWSACPSATRGTYRDLAARALAAGWRPPEPAPKREWPVSEDAVKAFYDAPRGGSPREEYQLGLRAAAPHLWRARVEGMTEEELASMCRAWSVATLLSESCENVRAALLALGDL